MLCCLLTHTPYPPYSFSLTPHCVLPTSYSSPCPLYSLSPISHPLLPTLSYPSPCPLSCCSLLIPSYSSPPAFTEDCYRAARRSQVEHESDILSHRRLQLRSMPSHCFPSVPLRTYIPTRCCSRKVSTRVRYFI